ncbi:MAG TPA: P1 family peptidase [Azospirillaceae bacterium]|nr:P1 family peptidase [Azospirillaceae bacterium]
MDPLAHLGVRIGELPAGPRDAITDVPGVAVGHRTLDGRTPDGAGVRTGVTALLPHGGNLFQDKVAAAGVVLNGFGKSTGLVQVDELGTIETPLVLTNTFAVGTAATALVRWTLRSNPAVGRTTSTVNPVVFECNDGRRNDLHAFAVTEAHVFEALEAAGPDFAQGAVGAGRGMTSFGRNGGIGSASRVVNVGGRTWTVGALVLSNFGRADDLRIDGRPARDVLRRESDGAPAGDQPDRGSVIVILATDLPLDHRQLRRLAKRAGVGLARVGGFWGHGSGDIACAFTTAYTIPHDSDAAVLTRPVLHEPLLDPAFRAAAFATEAAVLRAVLCGPPPVSP